MKSFWSLPLALLSLITIAPAHAWISEEIDDVSSIGCEGAYFKVAYNGSNFTGTARNPIGRTVDLSGKLNSVTIDTDDSSINIEVILDKPNPDGFRLFTIKSIQKRAEAFLHYDITRFGGSLGSGRCTVGFKSRS